MKKLGPMLILTTAVILIAAVSSVVSYWICCGRGMQPKRAGVDWIHSELGLTAEEQKALAPIDQQYDEKARALEEEMRQGNQELAKAILEDGGDSPRVRQAIGKIHTAMGELQHATIEHVFAMRGALTPEQYNKLLHYTADALGNLDSEHAGK